MNNSIVSPSATIGSRVHIGRFCIVEDDVVLGDGVIVEDYSLIMTGARIGDHTKVGTYCKIGRNTVIGSSCSFTSFCEIRDNCKLGNKVSMGSRCTLSANTVVEDDVIMKYGFVVTDTPDLRDNDRKKSGMLKSGSRFGANVVIMPSVTVGRNSEIGACSQVRHDVPDDEVWYGNPAKHFRSV